MSDGTRKVVNISEITGMEENVISMQEIFSFEEEGNRTRRQGNRRLPAQPYPTQIPRTASRRRHHAAGKHV